jgi:hypothetical protein
MHHHDAEAGVSFPISKKIPEQQLSCFPCGKKLRCGSSRVVLSGKVGNFFTITTTVL